MSPYIVQILFLLAGIMALLASIRNWDWFFNSHNASFIVRNFGRNRARLFYGILGFILIVMSLVVRYSSN